MEVLFIIAGYVGLINIAGFASMGIDKWKAKHRAWRIPEITLFVICLFGGSLGSTIGMYTFHHKTKHWYFRYGFPLILAVHLAVAAYIIGSKTFSIM